MIVTTIDLDSLRWELVQSFAREVGVALVDVTVQQAGGDAFVAFWLMSPPKARHQEWAAKVASDLRGRGVPVDIVCRFIGERRGMSSFDVKSKNGRRFIVELARPETPLYEGRDESFIWWAIVREMKADRAEFVSAVRCSASGPFVARLRGSGKLSEMRVVKMYRDRLEHALKQRPHPPRRLRLTSLSALAA